MHADTVHLGEEYLEHFGIKGMKWGVRKAEPSSGGSSSSSKKTPKKNPTKKILLGTTIVIGAIGAAYLISKNRTVKVSRIRVSGGGLSSAPSPFQMRTEAGLAANRNFLNRVGNQRLSDKTWRDAARMSQMSRARFSAGNKSITDMHDLNTRLTGFTDKQLRENLANPNYVWNF